MEILKSKFIIKSEKAAVMTEYLITFTIVLILFMGVGVLLSLAFANRAASSVESVSNPVPCGPDLSGDECL